LLFFAGLVLAADRVDARVPVFAFAACGRRFAAALRCGALVAALRRAVAVVFFAPAFFAVFLRAAVFLRGRFAVVAMIYSCA